MKGWEIQFGKPARDVMETQAGKTYCTVQVRFGETHGVGGTERSASIATEAMLFCHY